MKGNLWYVNLLPIACFSHTPLVLWLDVWKTVIELNYFRKFILFLFVCLKCELNLLINAMLRLKFRKEVECHRCSNAWKWGCLCEGVATLFSPDSHLCGLMAYIIAYHVFGILCFYSTLINWFQVLDYTQDYREDLMTWNMESVLDLFSTDKPSWHRIGQAVSNQ